MLKLIFIVCLPQQKFPELQEQATVFPSLKFVYILEVTYLFLLFVPCMGI